MVLMHYPYPDFEVAEKTKGGSLSLEIEKNFLRGLTTANKKVKFKNLDTDNA